MSTGYASGRALRLTTKVLPEHARGHNRSLLLQTLYRAGMHSRADLARETGLTRVTVSDLVAELMGEGLVVEMGQREDARPGKPATMLDLNREAFQLIGIDLSAADTFRGAVLDLDGRTLTRVELPLQDRTGADALALVIRLVDRLVAAATLPVLGVGVGSPGLVDLAGVVVSAPNLGWGHEPLQLELETHLNLPVVVANDANVAALAEHSFGESEGDLMLVKVGHGVGAGLLLDGTPLFGSRFAAGEIGHVVVGTDGGPLCVCGKHGCLEAWLAVPRLEAAMADGDADAVLAQAGRRLGIALAPIVGALDLAGIVLSGPAHLLDGTLLAATADTIRDRTSPQIHGALALRMTTLGEDIVVRGAAAMVLSARLGVS
ncbi:MAG TPA: ROK family transcriptional regulator [Rhodoglobus sp.]|nr:ROK family transcriptional regulator [Rhodoglobus sp.]